MVIKINITKPSHIIYYYEGHIKEGDKTYYFEIKDDGYDPQVNWLNEYTGYNLDINDEIIEKYLELWKN
jgi:hypothetical protein